MPVMATGTLTVQRPRWQPWAQWPQQRFNGAQLAVDRQIDAILFFDAHEQHDHIERFKAQRTEAGFRHQLFALDIAFGHDQLDDFFAQDIIRRQGAGGRSGGTRFAHDSSSNKSA
jgi:hypothetical protein